MPFEGLLRQTFKAPKCPFIICVEVLNFFTLVRPGANRVLIIFDDL